VSDLGQAQEHELAVVIGSALQLAEALGRRKRRLRRLLDDDQRAGREPSALAGGAERAFR
jgi:hypothetical protein